MGEVTDSGAFLPGSRLAEARMADREGFQMTSALSVTVLGASGSYADPGGACTGLLVRSPGANVWLDRQAGCNTDFVPGFRPGD